MIAKFVFLALFGVAFVQVRGNETEDAIQRAVEDVTGLSRTLDIKVENGIREYLQRQTSLRLATSYFLEKLIRIEDQSRTNVLRDSEVFQERAKRAGRPQSAINCIKKAEVSTIEKIRNIAQNFTENLRKLETTDSAALELAGKPLTEIKRSLRKRYDSAVKSIKYCGDVACVNRVAEEIRREYRNLFQEIVRISGRMNQAYNNYKRDAGTVFGTANKQIRRTTSEGIRSMKKCIYGPRILF